jgi:hypothetical protein
MFSMRSRHGGSCGGLFGIILLAIGDWIPGVINVASAVVGLAVQIPEIRSCAAPNCRPPPTSNPGS